MFDSARIFRPTARPFFDRYSSFSFFLSDSKAEGLKLLRLDNDFVAG